MSLPQAPVPDGKDYFAAGCLWGIACGLLLATLQTIFQKSFTQSTGSLALDQALVALSFGIQFGIAGTLAGSRLLGPTDNRKQGLHCGVALGIVGWLIGAAFQSVLWLFSFYVTWLIFGMGLSLLRARFASVSVAQGLLRGLLTSAVSAIPMSAALIMWAEPNPSKPSSTILIGLAWFATYALALGFVFTLGTKPESQAQ